MLETVMKRNLSFKDVENRWRSKSSKERGTRMLEAASEGVRRRYDRRTAARAITTASVTRDDRSITISQNFSRIGRIPVARLSYDALNNFWSLEIPQHETTWKLREVATNPETLLAGLDKGAYDQAIG
jgi:hypothetical protein